MLSPKMGLELLLPGRPDVRPLEVLNLWRSCWCWRSRGA
jgi:hypothetical protein